MLLQIGRFGIAIGHKNIVFGAYKERENDKCKGYGIYTVPEIDPTEFER